VAESDPYGRRQTEVFPELHSPADPPARRRDRDATALVAGVAFIVLAIVLMSGVDLSLDWFGHGIAWIALIGAGLALLVNEVVKSRRRDRT